MAEDQAQESMTAGANAIDAEIDALRVEREARLDDRQKLLSVVRHRTLSLGDIKPLDV